MFRLFLWLGFRIFLENPLREAGASFPVVKKEDRRPSPNYHSGFA